VSAAGALMAVLVETLAADPAVARLAEGIEPDRREPAGALPALTLAELATADWSTKTEAGADVLLALTAHARAGQTERARALLDAACAALSPPPPVPGWQLVSLVERARASAQAKGAAGPVRATAEWRARLLRVAS